MPEVNDLDGEVQGLTVRDYVQVLRRRWWLIALIVVAAGAAAFSFSSRQTKMYEATTKIVYAPQVNAASATSGQTTVDPYGQQDALDGVATAISNPVVQQHTAALVHTQAPVPASFNLTAQVETTSTTALLNAVVDIKATSSSAKVAQVAANAYAASFIAWRRQAEVGQISSALAALKAQMATFKTPAAQQSSNYLILVQSAQSLAIRKATATGDFSVVVPASLPEAPYAPKPLRNAILGLAVGLFVAIGLVFLLEQFDTRLRGQEEVARILGRPIIGRIPRIRQAAAKQPLPTLSDPDGQVAEAFRVLRGNLSYLTLDNEVHALAITSSQQGEGKSVTACNLAVAAALGGHRVILIEGDLRRPRIAEYLGLPNDRGLATVLTGTHNLVEALQRVDVKAPDETHADLPRQGIDRPPRLHVLTHGPKVPNPGEIVASRAFAHLIEEYKRHADLVIVDTPALLAVGDAVAIAGAVDGLVLVVDPARATRPTLQAAAEQLHRLPTRLLGAVVLQHRGHSTSYGYGYGGGYYDSASGNGKGSRPRPHAKGARQTGVVAPTRWTVADAAVADAKRDSRLVQGEEPAAQQLAPILRCSRCGAMFSSSQELRAHLCEARQNLPVV